VTARVPPEARALLVDIEGTTTPISFVHDVLFPFARAHLRGFLRDERSSEQIRSTLSRLKQEHQRDEQPPPWPGGIDDIDAAARYAEWLMDRDRKSPALKSLQGEIWDRGYRDGRLRGAVFDDVRPAFERWTARGFRIHIFSSGSVLAQRWLFATTNAGDLTQFISGYFDTGVGAKTDPDSYRRIAEAVKLQPRALLFISDVTRELDAARTAGVHAWLAERPGNAPSPDGGTYPRITTFDEVLV
jgi:enolase-phosphatase E1